MFNLLTAFSSIVGAMISLVIGHHIEGYTFSLLPITAGGFLYIAGPDPIPELQQEVKISTSLWQFVSIMLGVGIMAFLVVLE